MEKDLLYEKLQKYDFESLFKKKGYAYFTNGAYNLNIIGIRHKGNKVTNMFDDYMVVEYKTTSGIKTRFIYSITTDPGITYMNNPANSNGTAILVPAQYRGAYKLGLHKGKYAALVQNKPVSVYRDSNKDGKYDYDPKSIQTGFFGINIHKAGSLSTRVNNWSAGCQVFASGKDYVAFIRLCKEQIRAGMGETFTYTLLKEEELL